MNTGKLAQYKYETEAWKRRLCFMMEECIHAKNRIASVLKEPVDAGVLEELENFQSGFIEKDSLIAILRNETEEFDKLLLKKTFENVRNNTLISGAAKRLQRQIGFTEQAFNSYQKLFSQFLSENV